MRPPRPSSAFIGPRRRGLPSPGMTPAFCSRASRAPSPREPSLFEWGLSLAGPGGKPAPRGPYSPTARLSRSRQAKSSGATCLRFALKAAGRRGYGNGVDGAAMVAVRRAEGGYAERAPPRHRRSPVCRTAHPSSMCGLAAGEPHSAPQAAADLVIVEQGETRLAVGGAAQREQLARRRRPPAGDGARRPDRRRRDDRGGAPRGRLSRRSPPPVPREEDGAISTTSILELAASARISMPSRTRPVGEAAMRRRSATRACTMCCTVERGQVDAARNLTEAESPQARRAKP